MIARKRGRKPISESRATEIRARLAAWKQSPEPRISLRELAVELDTSHQLLSFYARGWDKWQEGEYRREANAIRERADAENRSMSESEMERELAYRQAAGRHMAASVLSKIFKDFEAEARRGGLHPKIASWLATLNDPMAQKILRLSQKRQTESSTNLDAVLKQLNRTTDSEKALRLIRQLTPEQQKKLKALWEKRSRTVKSKINLPLGSISTRKSFKSA